MLKEEELKDAALLVFANKQDVSNAMDVNLITNYLKLNDHRKHHWKVQPSDATTGMGLFEGLDWLCTKLREQKS